MEMTRPSMMIASMMEVPGVAMRITKSAATGLAYNSAHRADIFHSTVSATNRDHQERGRIQRKKIRTGVQQKQAKHGVSQMW